MDVAKVGRKAKWMWQTWGGRKSEYGLLREEGKVGVFKEAVSQYFYNLFLPKSNRLRLLWTGFANRFVYHKKY